jgi:hypothetical protein
MDRRKWLIGITLFNCVTAFAGAVQLISGWYAPPDSWLQNTPFSSYVVPGLILGIVVGGSACLATILQFNNYRSAPIFTLGSGVIMISWICGEIAMVQHISWLQLLYTILAATLIALTYTDSKRFLLNPDGVSPHEHRRLLFH